MAAMSDSSWTSDDDEDVKIIPVEHEKYVDPGTAAWREQRAAWRSKSGTGKQVMGLDMEQEAEVMECIRTNRRFVEPVPLSVMVDMLSAMWEDEEPL